MDYLTGTVWIDNAFQFFNPFILMDARKTDSLKAAYWWRPNHDDGGGGRASKTMVFGFSGTEDGGGTTEWGMCRGGRWGSKGPVRGSGGGIDHRDGR